MNMKKQLITFMMIFLGLSWACSEDEDNHLPVIEVYSQMPRDGNFHGFVMEIWNG